MQINRFFIGSICLRKQTTDFQEQIIHFNLTFLTYLNQSISLINEICFRKQITDTSQLPSQ